MSAQMSVSFTEDAMGLFDFLSKKERKRPAPAKKEESLLEYSGMRMEVLTEEKELLFVGRLVVKDGGEGELQRTSADNVLPEAAPEEEPPGEENTEEKTEENGEKKAAAPAEKPTFHVLLRGYEESVRQAVHMKADITHDRGRVWQVRRIKVVSKDNDRAFFRQDVGTDGEVLPLAHLGNVPFPCKLLNISAGGACVQTDYVFEPGEKLLLKSRLLPDSELKPVVCSVRRVTERKGGLFDYGCKFTELDAAAEDEISKAILQLQMRRMRR